MEPYECMTDTGWDEVTWKIWHIMTAKADAVVWTEMELQRAVGGDFRYNWGEVRSAVDALFICGYITSAFPKEGWRRA